MGNETLVIGEGSASLGLIQSHGQACLVEYPNQFGGALGVQHRKWVSVSALQALSLEIMKRGEGGFGGGLLPCLSTCLKFWLLVFHAPSRLPCTWTSHWSLDLCIVVATIHRVNRSVSATLQPSYIQLCFNIIKLVRWVKSAIPCNPIRPQKII